MGFSFHATGRVKRTEECWIQSQTINNGVPRAAAKTKEKPAGGNRRFAGQDDIAELAIAHGPGRTFFRNPRPTSHYRRFHASLAAEMTRRSLEPEAPQTANSARKPRQFAQGDLI